jgi:hypothetical protein
MTTTEAPYASWIDDDSDAPGGPVHAVAVTDGVPAPLTLCGETVAGSVEGVFSNTASRARCRYCADVLGVSHT